MKTLVIITHPDMEHSRVNKVWKQTLLEHADRFDIHDLYSRYPDGNIDVLAEQKLMEQYDKIVFQFPVFWFSCPAFLKKWIDEVLIYGWAYGSKSGYKLQGKKIALAMSVGLEKYEYTASEKYKYTLEELLRPFELTFDYVKADYRSFYAFYGIEQNTSDTYIRQSIPSYLDFLNTL